MGVITPYFLPYYNVERIVAQYNTRIALSGISHLSGDPCATASYNQVWFLLQIH